MSAKPAKEDRHIVMAAAVATPPGETTATKRTQGGSQAAAGFALPRRLIQPRNKREADGDALNVAEASTKETLWPVSGDPSGSTQTVASEQGSGLELGRPVILPGSGEGWSDQKKDNPKESRESDPSIVVRDGSAAYMAKGRAGEQRWQSTHAGAWTASPQSVSRSLLALRQKAAAEPKYRFRSLYRMIDLPMLYECFHQLRRGAAPGVDGLDVAEFGERLNERLADLLERLRDQTYRAQLVRRRYIPKPGSTKQRPLGIPVVEDKLVQMAAGRILEAIYEADFLDSSMGYRSGRAARAATQQLQHVLFHGRIGWIVEADIEGFFDHLDHDWLIKMLEQRVNDRCFLRLIRKWLKAGILEVDGRVLHPVTGTPQGGIVSPILANIYLHYVLDLWTERTVRRGCRGQLEYMRYADDFVCGFEEETEARRYLDELRGRLAKFGLTLAEAKSGIVRFHRNDPGGGSFTFLGFDFYWGNTRRDFPTVKRRTAKKKIRASFAALKEWLQKNRSRRLRWLGEGLRAKFQGYWNYFGVIGNSKSLQVYWRGAKRLVFKWWNRRSQRRSYNWTTFEAMWQTLGFPVPRIVETPYLAQHILPLPS